MHSVSARAWMRVAPACVCPRVISTFCSGLQAIIAGCQKSVREIGFLWTKNDSILSEINRVIRQKRCFSGVQVAKGWRCRVKMAEMGLALGGCTGRAVLANRVTRVRVQNGLKRRTAALYLGEMLDPFSLYRGQQGCKGYKNDKKPVGYQRVINCIMQLGD